MTAPETITHEDPSSPVKWAVIGVVLAVLVILGAIILKASGSSNDSPLPVAELPAGVSAPNYGTPRVGNGPTQVDIYEDFQCPACGNLEKLYGKNIASLIAENKISVSYFPMTFLDDRLKNTASVAATAAYGCAVDAGKTLEYHQQVFDNQPATEGTGWTTDQLLSFGKDAGITGPAYDSFAQCVQSHKYLDWGPAVTQAAFSRGLQATPTVYVNGNKLSPDAYESVDTFVAALQGQQ